MTIALKKNVPGYVDELGRFRPIRSASFVGSGGSRRTAKVKDRKKYSRAKAGDLGKLKQERALEAPWDREYRLDQEAKAAEKREQDRITRDLEREIYGETSGRTSRGKAMSLAQFVRSEGGINTKKKVRRGITRYGDSLENFTRKGSGTTGLVTTTPGKGKSLDYMHQAAREAGYDVASMDDLLDALDNEIRSGKKTYSTHGSMTYNPRAKNPTIAQTILQQLGGSKFVAMTGAKALTNTGKGLRFRLPANFAAGGINFVTVTLNGRDLYDVEFGKLRGAKYSVVKIDKNVYADMIRELFTMRTGLDTSLGTVGRKNPIRILKHKFYVGQKLATRFIGDNDLILRGEVISRTPKFVTVKVEGERELKRCGVRVWGDTEIIDPLGKYSMAPTFWASEGNKDGTKKNPDLLGMFANAAVGIASTLQIHEMVKRKSRRTAPKKRGTTKAKATKRRNPTALQKPARSKGVSRTRTSRTNPSQSNLFKSKRPHGDLYVLTIGSGDDLISVYLHDGDKDGFSKRFKTMAGAKAYATRNKVKLIENPAAVKVNGIIKRAWARSRARAEYGRELRLEAAAERSRARRRKAEAAARSNPRRSTNGKKAVARSAKANSTRPAKYITRDGVEYGLSVSGLRPESTGRYVQKQMNGDGIVVRTGEKYAFYRPLSDRIKKLRTKAKAQKPKAAAKRKTVNPQSAIRNPKSTARRRTYEMFQGRRATKATSMLVSNHAPARLDALGDLIELKIAGGPTLKFNGKGVKLCAANGKLWIAGKRFAKPNPAAKANELNPIGEIDHVVYGTYKPHHGDHNYTHYIHKLGEESGKRPILCVDREGFPVFRGGNYKIEARGIVD